MSTTQKQAPAAAAEAPAPAAGGVSQETAAEAGAAPAAETTGHGAGDTAAPAANENGAAGGGEAGGQQTNDEGGAADDGLSPLQRAHRRAAERLKERGAGEQQPSTPGSEEQAAAGEAGGESTATSGEAKPQASDEAAAASADAGTKPGETASTAPAAPENWPADRREAFSKLPDDNARNLVLEMNRDMEAGLNKAFQDIAQIRDSHGKLVDTMEQTGYSQEGATELLKLGKAFQEDPKAVLRQLASDNGIDVWFERPQAEGDIPEFNSTAEMVQYMEQRAQKIAEDMVSSERQKAQTEAEKKAEEERATQAQAAIRQELEEAAKTHADFNDHRVNVMETAQRLNEEGATIEEAYRLSTYDGLRKLAEEGEAAKQELAALKAKLEKESKESTRPAPGARGGGAATPNEDEDLSPLQRAHKRAAAKVQARRSAV